MSAADRRAAKEQASGEAVDGTPVDSARREDLRQVDGVSVEPEGEEGGGENPGLEDAAWVEASLAGDSSGFEKLVTKYQRQAVVVSYRLLGNHDDARDVTQDAFVKAFRSLDTLERPAAFGGWLMRIVTNLSLNYRRGRSLRIAQPIDDAMTQSPGGSGEKPMRGHGSDSLALGNDPQRRAESRELGEALAEALKQLPEKQRDALTMFTIQEMPQKDVAQALGCSVEAVKWHVFQGRKRLRELLKDTM